MPIYEYRCKKCGKEFEYRQGIKDDALTTCPADICGEDVKCEGEVVRLISKNVGLVFNGSGFYLTDYGKKKSSVPPKTRKEEASACSGSSSCVNCSGNDVPKTA